MIAKERLFLCVDKKTVVRESDRRARFLLCPKGRETPKGYEYPAELVTGKEAIVREDKEVKNIPNKSGLVINRLKDRNEKRRGRR